MSAMKTKGDSKSKMREFEYDYDNNLGGLLANKTYWPIYFIICMLISVLGVGYMIGVAHWEVPPLCNFENSKGGVVITADAINHGEEIFHLRGLMAYGTFLGDGSERGPDYTAEALHIMTVSMKAHYDAELGENPSINEKLGVKERVRKEIHDSDGVYDKKRDVVILNDAQVRAWNDIKAHYKRMYNEPNQYLHAVERISSAVEVEHLAAFFFWGGWISSSNRPGKTYSWTHNWPYDPEAGNYPTPEVMMWSMVSILILFTGLMTTLYVYGQCREEETCTAQSLTTQDLECDVVRPTQRATMKFFILSFAAFAIQTFAGIACAIDYVRPFGFSICGIIPFTVFRSYHTTFQIYWFFVAWVGATIFALPRFSKEPIGQSFLIELLFLGCFLVAAGGTIGIPLGQMGILKGSIGYYFGSQGWEYMELGRFWQDILLAGFVLWIAILFRGVSPYLTWKRIWSPPAWLFYGSMVMVAFLFFSLKVTPKTNFVVSDFWRWMVVHMWVEVTFEVFTTVIVSYLLAEMGLISHKMSEKTTYIAVMLFFLTATIGIGHNFYWIAKPTGVIALGSAFSTTQVLPLILLTLDAWKNMQEAEKAEAEQSKGNQKFVMKEVWLFILAINFWNIFGAGCMGSCVNLPIINYFLHSSYITGGHAHAAMFGVKGNVALASMLYCVQHLVKKEDWPASLVRTAFWCLQGGMVMMIFMDLFPTGVYQVFIAVKYGFWVSRDYATTDGAVFQTLAKMRAFGGHVFVWGGLCPLCYLVCSRYYCMKPVTKPEFMARSAWLLDEDKKSI